MEKVDITIVGAGVVGLAIASKLANNFDNVIVVEKEDSFGQGISSRNSEVIHAGFHYPTNSLKAKMCVEGNRMLYQLCQDNNIPFKKTGKLTVATDPKEAKQVDILYKQGKDNAVEGLEVIEAEEIKKREPNIRGICALYSKETGIVDSHKLMVYLNKKAREEGASLVYQSQVKTIRKENNAYKIEIQDNRKDSFMFETRFVVNSAGLNSDLVAKLAGLDIKKLNYELKYCKGEYFRLSSAKSKLVNRLVYPVPKQSQGGLGIHLTPDISGQVKLGPSAEYLKENKENYDVDKSKQKEFYDSVKKFAPFIEMPDIYPDMSGIRPKLEGPGDGFKDFVIKEESDNGLPGFINLIGIESPGLTACLAIAKYVGQLLIQ
jgi:L-2-hydroxyglutarate oxidase LhgO